jgi:hypothetical protein
MTRTRIDHNCLLQHSPLFLSRMDCELVSVPWKTRISILVLSKRSQSCPPVVVRARAGRGIDPGLRGTTHLCSVCHSLDW